MVTCSPSCLAMSWMYATSLHRQRIVRACAGPTARARARAAACRSRPARTATRLRSPTFCSVIAASAQSMAPSNGTRWSSDTRRLSCRCVVTRCPDTASMASTRSPIRNAWPVSRQMPMSVASSSLLDAPSPGRRRPKSGSGSPRAPAGRPTARRRRARASRLRSTASRRLSRPSGCWASGTPRCSDQEAGLRAARPRAARRRSRRPPRFARASSVVASE